MAPGSMGTPKPRAQQNMTPPICRRVRKRDRRPAAVPAGGHKGKGSRKVNDIARRWGGAPPRRRPGGTGRGVLRARPPAGSAGWRDPTGGLGADSLGFGAALQPRRRIPAVARVPAPQPEHRSATAMKLQRPFRYFVQTTGNVRWSGDAARAGCVGSAAAPLAECRPPVSHAACGRAAAVLCSDLALLGLSVLVWAPLAPRGHTSVPLLLVELAARASGCGSASAAVGVPAPEPTTSQFATGSATLPHGACDRRIPRSLGDSREG
eukprot:gene1816-biopygen944